MASPPRPGDRVLLTLSRRGRWFVATVRWAYQRRNGIAVSVQLQDQTYHTAEPGEWRSTVTIEKLKQQRNTASGLIVICKRHGLPCGELLAWMKESGEELKRLEGEVVK